MFSGSPGVRLEQRRLHHARRQTVAPRALLEGRVGHELEEELPRSGASPGDRQPDLGPGEPERGAEAPRSKGLQESIEVVAVVEVDDFCEVPTCVRSLCCVDPAGLVPAGVDDVVGGTPVPVVQPPNGVFPPDRRHATASPRKEVAEESRPVDETCRSSSGAEQRAPLPVALFRRQTRLTMIQKWGVTAISRDRRLSEPPEGQTPLGRRRSLGEKSSGLTAFQGWKATVAYHLGEVKTVDP